MTKRQARAKEAAACLAVKAKRVIDSAEGSHKDAVTRYLTLFNMAYNPLTRTLWWVDAFGAVGAAMGLKACYESKFGSFVAALTPARVTEVKTP